MESGEGENLEKCSMCLGTLANAAFFMMNLTNFIIITIIIVVIVVDVFAAAEVSRMQ